MEHQQNQIIFYKHIVIYKKKIKATLKWLLFFLSGCGESLLHSLFLCLNLFLCVNTDKKEEKERVFMMGALKNHRDERVSVSVEELVPQDHFRFLSQDLNLHHRL
ncbi:hypothetical protein Q0N71_29260 [Bacillus thuringiensis]|uniref:hypothetical protein n=1 Tax=Bacillus thuringiensis TaxID=1428 RepID=UPI003457CE6E